VARPTKLTPELQAKLCALLEAEWYMVHACAEVGIHPDTVYGWIREAASDTASADIIEFSVACARARAKGERSILERMELFAQEKKEKDWKVLSWKLERLRQDVFHLTTKTELSGPNGGPVETTARVVVLPPLGADDDKPLD